MAQIFLDGLPRVDLETLPAESRCMICLDRYDTETDEGDAVETVVRLPCGHDVGAECIRTWLSPDREARNSCPACRMAFFPALPRPYMEHGTIEDAQDEEDDWHGARGRANLPLWASGFDFFQDILRIIGEDGQPPQEGQEVLQGEAREETARDLVRGWLPEFFGTTTEQYQESIRRARAVITTPRAPPPGADMNYWSPYPYLQLSASEPINPEEVDSQHLDLVVKTLATAFRTLAFREALTYSVLRVSGAEAQPPDGHLRPLSADQEETLFRELERRGAFDEIDVFAEP